MNSYAVPLWLIIFFLSFQLLLLTIITYFTMDWLKKFFSDKIMILDKTNRWKMHYKNTYGAESINIGKKKYFLKGTPPLNKLGRAFFVFSENKPMPLELNYNKAGWLSAETLKDVINNKIVQQIVKPTERIVEILLILGAIGGVIAGLASVVNLLISTGVIQSTVP